MAKLARVDQKIFGETGATDQFGKVGSEAAGLPATTKDLAQIQSLAQYLGGLYAITNDGNEPPRIEDVNSIYYMLTVQLRYFFQMGMPEYHADQDYYIGSWAQVAGVLYVSLTGTDGTPNIGNNPTSSPTDWKQIDLDMIADGTTYKRIAAATATKINAGTYSEDDIADGTTYKRVVAAGSTALNAAAANYTPYFLGPGELVFSMLTATALATRRVIALTGQVLTIASYPELCAAVYCGDANNPTADCFYKTSDALGATRSTSGTYMVMADARGLAIVGIGANLKITAVNGSNYTGGSAVARYLTDMMVGHRHAPLAGGGIASASGSGSGDTGLAGARPVNNASTGDPVTDGTYGLPRLGAYNRGPSLGAQICIVY